MSENNWYEEVETVTDRTITYELWQLDDNGEREFQVKQDVQIFVDTLKAVALAGDIEIPAEFGAEITFTFRDGQNYTMIVSPSEQ